MEIAKYCIDFAPRAIEALRKFEQRPAKELEKKVVWQDIARRVAPGAQNEEVRALVNAAIRHVSVLYTDPTMGTLVRVARLELEGSYREQRR